MKPSIIRIWTVFSTLLALAACSVAGPATATVTPTALPTLPTTAMPSPRPGDVFPIVDGGGLLLGGVTGGKWLDADTTAALLPRTVHYRMFDGSELHSRSTGEIEQRNYGNDPCPYPSVLLSPDDLFTDTIGVAGDWNVTPRIPESLDMDNPEYKAAIQTLLVENGIAAPEVILTGVYRVDLEDDGTDEVLISAVRLSNIQTVKAGEYTLVALRKEVNGQVETIPFILTTYLENNDLARSWTPTIEALLDLNGDGDLEIVVNQLAKGGGFTRVFEVDGAEVRMALSAGCSLPMLRGLPTPTIVPTPRPNTAGVFPILAGMRVLGGVKDGQWLDPATTAALAPSEILYRLFANGSLAGEGSGSITSSTGACPGEAYRVEEAYDWEPMGAIGVAGDWDVTPRAPESLGLEIPEYISIVEVLLVENGIAAPEVALDAVSRVDLEGDGTDEVLISAARLYGMQYESSIRPGVLAGDHSVIALRKVVGGEAKTFVLSLTTYPEEDIMARPWLPTVGGLLDLNGDGDLEIVIKRRAFEGSFTEVYEVTGEDVRMALSGGCSL